MKKGDEVEVIAARNRAATLYCPPDIAVGSKGVIKKILKHEGEETGFYEVEFWTGPATGSFEITIHRSLLSPVSILELKKK